MIMKTKKYAIFVRASGSNRGKSNHTQLMTLYDLAEEKSLNVVLVCKEFGPLINETFERDRLIQAVEQGEINGILCVGIDRLTRNVEYLSKYYKLIQEGKLEVVMPSGSITSGDKNLMWAFIPSLVRLDSEMRSERIKHGIAQKKYKLLREAYIRSKGGE